MIFSNFYFYIIYSEQILKYKEVDKLVFMAYLQGKKLVFSCNWNRLKMLLCAL